MLDIKSKLDNLLMRVNKPARYTGGEINSVIKDANSVDIRFAFAFPDVYEVGMSHLGLKILYHLMNDRDDTYCERVFAPWVDMENLMRENDIPLFSLETKTPLNMFDIIGFTLQYELSYTNILNMLDLSKIPVRSKDRHGYPLIIAGGPCAYNPAPLSDVVDLFVIGDGEEIINELLDLVKVCKKDGTPKEVLLRRASKIQGVYVPSFYREVYNCDNTIRTIEPLNEDVPDKVKKRVVKDLDKTYHPDRQIVPFINTVHDRIILEVFRGCTRGCRFCQAGMIYRPVRERSKKTLLELADKLIKSTGYEEISLTSLSTCDYSEIESLIFDLIEKYKDRGVGVALPSTRIDAFSVNLLNEIQKVRKTGLTLAPEAGTQRLRDVINKGVTEKDLINSTREAFKAGWRSVKLYFMLGLPTETMEDVKGISDLAHLVADVYKEVNGNTKGLKITVSTSTFVPKPFTPFQWCHQDDMDTIIKKQNYLKELLKGKIFHYNWHEPKVSFLEAVISKGDRKVGQALIKAWESGCKFDGWDEYFKFDNWLKAFESVGIDPRFYAYKERDFKEIFPWDVIDAGVKKDYLVREYKNALEGRLTNDCRLYCTGCGIKDLDEGVVCFETEKQI
ncbi:B12-binding domain-containing radical SAM protein [Thermoanaerobacterium thermosaccharolyticum]|uniref:TIGR03960 family B12-binding radical SAM protein n=1 Tax=Thermoanaerobacterium thermosaccharolyticum TaxID=1517 RepID=UPI000C07122E|nr:TIGR03960 family B12-binding radical SAM protein [Thermoanaerobacterium thermosaccharolyticum]PHO08399.1 B12-binding domain-containing radical SAM protein [Thermoanaerobacterium thermosaccharolyticum]